MTSKIEQARSLGYSDDDILNEFAKTGSTASSKISEARKAGYTSQQILDQMSGKKRPLSEATARAPESTVNEQVKAFSKKAGRVGMQLGIGAAEAALIPHDLLVAGSRIEKTLTEPVYEATGFPEELKPLGRKYAEFPTTGEAAKKIGERFGIDTEPQGVLEKGARLAGLLKQAPISYLEKQAAKGAQKLAGWLNEPAKKQIQGLAASTPIAAAVAGTEEVFGVPEWAGLMGITTGLMGAKAALTGAGKLAQWAGKRFFLFDPANFVKKDAIKAFEAEVKRGPEEARKQLKDGLITAEQYQKMKPYLDTAVKHEIPLMPSTLSDSVRFKRIENIIARNDMTEPAAQAFRQRSAERWAESYQSAIKDMAQDAKFSSREGIAEALATDVTKVKHFELEKQYRQHYDKSRDLFRKEKPVSKEGVKEIENSLTQVYKALGETRIPSSGETATRNIAARGQEAFRTAPESITPAAAGRPELEQFRFPVGTLQEQALAESQQAIQQAPGRRTMMQAEARTKRATEQTKLEQAKAQQDLARLFGPDAKHMEVTADGSIRFNKEAEALKPSELVATKRSLSDPINWEFPDTKNLLKGPRAVIDNVLTKEYGNTQAYQQMKAGDKFYADSKKLFGQDGRWKKWGLRQDNLPNELELTMRNLERFKQFEKDFGNTPGGRQLIDYMKRQRLEEMLAPIFSGGMYQPGQITKGFSGLMGNRETRAQFEHFASPQAKKNLEDLRALDRRIYETSSKFYKGAADRAEGDDLKAMIYGLLNPTQWAFSIGNKLSQDRLASTYAEIFTNPRWTQEMKEIGEEALKTLNGKPDIGRLQLLKDRIQLFWDDLASERKIVSQIAPSRYPVQEPEEAP